MGKLSNLKPAFGTLRSNILPMRDASGHNAKVEYWRGWYGLKRWRDLRMATFVRDLFTCQMQGCGKLIGDTSKLVADHVTPHRGNARLFWDPTNVQTLCTWCHSKLKQAEERASAQGGGYPKV